ncbi:thiamine pyrophosphate-binding protein [Phyllobacterium sp. SB3]|uniref:thiamine pyrophosphate-binding protein n=1 Tax=Phyllobacterium sp. SB3 TaxID=3156073 RepID=UPI0032AE9935
MTGAEIVLQALRDNGVEHIFGYPGAAVLPIYDELFRQTDIRHILVRHEQGAGHAAEGYARSTGKVGVMLVTSGPGATNAVTPLQNAMSDCVPIVCLSGQVATALIGTDAFQECDTVGITRPCTKNSWLVTDVSELSTTIHKAFRLARSGRPGPVLVDIPKDILVRTACYTPVSAVAWPEHYNPPEGGTDKRMEIAHHGPSSDETIIARKYALDRLYELTRDHAPYVAIDMHWHRECAARFNHAGQSSRWIAPSGFGTMGYGLPAAIGTQIAHPESLVIDIADASSVQTTMKELSTAIQYDAPIKVFILNNGSTEFGGYLKSLYRSCLNSLPDFVKLAEAFGAVGIRCDKPDDLDETIGEMLAVRRPVLFDCRVA